jgi:hypothetical protein
MSVIWEAPPAKIGSPYRVYFEASTGNIISVTNDIEQQDD